MLEMRPLCEACGRILLPERDGAFICSMECTFCSDCVVGALDGACPNCRGELRPRPPRVGDLLARYPAGAGRTA